MNSQTSQPRTWLTVLVATLCAATILQNTTSYAGQEKLSAKMDETSSEVIRTRDQLQATMSALSSLVAQKKGDLKPAYQQFSSEVTKTQAAAAWTKQTALDMKQQSAAYFGEWQQDLNGVSNEKLRAKAQKRMAKVQKNYDNASGELENAGSQVHPIPLRPRRHPEGSRQRLDRRRD